MQRATLLLCIVALAACAGLGKPQLLTEVADPVAFLHARKVLGEGLCKVNTDKGVVLLPCVTYRENQNSLLVAIYHPETANLLAISRLSRSGTQRLIWQHQESTVRAGIVIT